MNRRHNAVSYTKIAILALGALVLLFAGIWNNAWGSDLTRAPVVTASKTEGVMEQTGWYSYERKQGIVVLYCVPEGETLLTCVVFVVTEKGNAVVLVDGIPASERAT